MVQLQMENGEILMEIPEEEDGLTDKNITAIFGV